MDEFCSPLKPDSESLLTRELALLIGWRQHKPQRGGGAAASIGAIKSSTTGVAGSFIDTIIVHRSNCCAAKTHARTHTYAHYFKITLLPPTCPLLLVHTFPPQRDRRDVHLSSEPEADLTFLDTVSSQSAGTSLPNPNTACRKVEEKEGPKILTLGT